MVALGLALAAVLAIRFLRRELATGIFLTCRIVVMLGMEILKVAVGGMLTLIGFPTVGAENSIWGVVGALTILKGWVMIVRSLGAVTSIATVRTPDETTTVPREVLLRSGTIGKR
jgi:hypothetical protein